MKKKRKKRKRKTFWCHACKEGAIFQSDFPLILDINGLNKKKIKKKKKKKKKRKKKKKKKRQLRPTI
jgi:hypothetical protein